MKDETVLLEKTEHISQNTDLNKTKEIIIYYENTFCACAKILL